MGDTIGQANPYKLGAWSVIFALGCSSSPTSSTDDCTGPDEAYTLRWAEADPPPSCVPQPVCPHKGGNSYSVAHNTCADRSGNVAWDGQLLSNDQLPDLRDPPDGRAGQGCDVLVAGRNFDAMSWSLMRKYRRLWEVSTRDYSNCYKYEKIWSIVLNRILDQFVRDCLLILTCNKDIVAEEDKFTLIWGFSDPGLYWAVVNHFASADNYEREIMSQVRALGLQDDPRVYCQVDNLQRCR